MRHYLLETHARRRSTKIEQPTAATAEHDGRQNPSTHHLPPCRLIELQSGESATPPLARPSALPVDRCWSVPAPPPDTKPGPDCHSPPGPHPPAHPAPLHEAPGKPH